MDWITHIKYNRNNALKELYVLYRDECIRWQVKSFNVNEELAKDAFQLSIIILYQNITNNQLIKLTSDIKTYLFSIVKNKIRDLIKKESKYISEGIMANIKEEMTDDIADKEHFEELFTSVTKAIGQMGDPCKSILNLFYFHKMKFEQISQLVGHNNPGTTKTKKYKCLKRLNKMILKAAA